MQAPGAEPVEQARRLVAAMRANPRGPYQRIAWFCEDGTLQPPQAFACRERGGGRQHAVYSKDRERLAELGWHVGTIFAAHPPAYFRNPATRDARLRELILERYLTDIDDGWVLHRARDYRGRVQVEDEEAAGQALLLALLAEPDWAQRNYLLLRELARSVPHRGGDDPTRALRRGAVVLAEQAPEFQSLRVEIHTTPSAATAARVRRWAAACGAGERCELALALAQQLDRLYGPSGRQVRLNEASIRLQQQTDTRQLGEALAAAASSSGAARIELLATALTRVRAIVTSDRLAARRLAVLDLTSDIEAELNISTQELLSSRPLPRRDLVELSALLAGAGRDVGLLTSGELAALSALLPAGVDDLAIADYRMLTHALLRVPAWAAGSLRYHFAEALNTYSALDPRAARFVDDALRGSVLLPLADVSRLLARDAERLTGVRQRLFDKPGDGLFALNPGVAAGPLRILGSTDAEALAGLARTDIVVLPETAAELPPVAGILTLGEGNPLSHVQLLARNFGIPNVAILPELLQGLQTAEGVEVLLAAGSSGDVVIERLAALPANSTDLVVRAQSAPERVVIPAPDLSMNEPLPLDRLNKTLSGRWVGPKAANLGELNRLFPGRVAAALALPFGSFAQHLAAGERDLRAELEAAYRDPDERRRRATLDELRTAIAALEIDAPTRERLSVDMRELFGPDGSYGVFVRSDTNVEDLPQFTGAGLNETVPHVVGLDRQLATVPRVWASVLSERAIAWRSTVLENPADVYVSVLLMRSVPATKSGVLVTANLADGGPGLTVSAAWGVGGAVAGEAAETRVLLDDGEELLVAEAKTPWQRSLPPEGGIAWVPAPDGQVLDEVEKQALRQLAEEVGQRYEPSLNDNGQPRPWDIEFGFVEGQLTLFQIRPLVDRGPLRADRLLAKLLPGAVVRARRVDLSQMPLTSDDDVVSRGPAPVGARP